MSMTKKDYEAVADTLGEFYKKWNDDGEPEWRNIIDGIVHDLSERFKEMNPKFQPNVFLDRFLDKAGLVPRIGGCGVVGHPSWSHDCKITDHVAKVYGEH